MLTPDEQATLDTYNNIAPQWVSRHNALDFWDKEYKVFQSYLSKGKIIDLGCGGGRDSVWFEKNGYDYTGVDISEGMLVEARKRYPKTKFLQQDFYSLNFPEESFDGFWFACSLLHIPKDRINEALNKIKSILKPGAVGFISIKQGTNYSKKESGKSDKERFFVYYEPEEFIAILKNQGFKILDTGARPPKETDQDGTYLVFYVKLV